MCLQPQTRLAALFWARMTVSLFYKIQIYTSSTKFSSFSSARIWEISIDSSNYILCILVHKFDNQNLHSSIKHWTFLIIPDALVEVNCFYCSKDSTGTKSKYKIRKDQLFAFLRVYWSKSFTNYLDLCVFFYCFQK